MTQYISILSIKKTFFSIMYFLMKLLFIVYENFYHIYIQLIVFYNKNFNNYDIYFINNSLIILKYNYCDIHKLKTLPEYNFIVYKKTSNDKTYTIILDKLDDLNNFTNNETIILEQCNYSFIYVAIKANNKTYDITKILNDNNNYYYINNSNILNKTFIDWICIYHLDKILYNYEISIIDNNINEISINNLQCIKLNKNNYIIS